jgi:hypothetical protein
MSELPIGFLAKVIFGDNMGLDGSADVDEFPNEFEKLKDAGAVRAEMAKSNGNHSVVFDWGIPPASEIDDDANSPLYKSPVIVRNDGPRTLAKKLGVVRTEEVVTASGDRWTHAFNAAGDLVDTRLLQSAESS